MDAARREGMTSLDGCAATDGTSVRPMPDRLSSELERRLWFVPKVLRKDSSFDGSW